MSALMVTLLPSLEPIVPLAEKAASRIQQVKPFIADVKSGDPLISLKF